MMIGKWLLRSNCLCALLIVGLGCSVASASIVYDDFDGASVDLSKWTLYEGTTVSQSGSVVTLDGSTTWMTMRSTASYDGAVQNTYEFKYVGNTGTDNSPYFGLSTDSGAYHSVVIRKQGGIWAANINGVYIGALPTPTANDIWGITRTADTWKFSLNGSAVLESDPGVIGFDAGETPKFLMQVRPGDTLSMDWVAVIPEPATVGLLGFGSFMMCLRRKRK